MSQGVVCVGLISDTHVPDALARLPESLSSAFKGMDCLLHAGDLTTLRVLEELSLLAPIAAVSGNCDPPEVARQLPDRLVLTLAGHRVGVHHGHQGHSLQNQYIERAYDAPEFDLFYQAMSTQLPNCRVIIFGHFHAPVVREWRDTLFVNPGSVAPPHARPTCAILELGEEVTAHICLLS